MRKTLEDARYIKSERAILKAASRILNEKYLADMTISEICAKAGVTRSTFYRHFTDIRGVMDKLEDNIFTEFTNLLGRTNDSNISSRSIFRKILIFMYEEHGYFQSAYKHYNIRMYRRIIRAMYPLAVKKWGNAYDVHNKTSTLAYYSCAYGIVGIVGYWMIDDNHDFKLIDEYVDLIVSFVNRNIHQALKETN